jgi:hypothetical protein
MLYIKYYVVLFLLMLVVVITGCTTTYEEQPKETVEVRQSGISEEELAEIDWLIKMGVNALPEDERDLLLDLHEKFESGGYSALSYDEIFTMRDLNEKAIMLLPVGKQLRFGYLTSKLNSTGMFTDEDAE